MKNNTILLLFCLLVIFGCTKQEEGSTDRGCSSPSNVTGTLATSSSLSYSWDAVSGAQRYKMNYTREEDSFASPDYFTENTAYTFSGLTEGHYEIRFYTVCIDGSTSQAFIIDDMIIR